MILNDNSTQQINTLVIQLQNRITNLNNEFRKLNTEISDLNTEISDLERKVSSNENDASDMNTEISDLERRVNSLANDATAMSTEISANTEAISGKADKNHTHTKSEITDFPTSLKNPNALTINGQTYDGSTAVDAGVQTIANGGTGATTALGAFESLANGLPEGAGPLDTEHIIFQNENRKNWGLYTLFQFWEYIKGKISSVLGLTKDNYGGKADTAGTADGAIRLKTFASWDEQYVYDPTNGVRVNVYKITMQNAFNSILVQIYDDINYARCRRYVLGLWHVPNYGYNVSVTDLGGAKDNGIKVWMGTDGNVYLQADVYWTSRISFSYIEDQYYLNVSVTKIGEAKYGSNKDINGNVLFTPLGDSIMDCGAIRADDRLSAASKVPQILKTDVMRTNVMTASSKMVIPIGEPSYLEDGCIWIER